MEAVLVGTIYDDPPLPIFGSHVYDAEVRNRGLDWPKSAFSMIGSARMRNLRVLTERVIKERVLGDIVETGVWRGGASIMARAVLEAYEDRSRRVIAADSFAGLPAPDSNYDADVGSNFHEYSELVVSEDEVRRNFAKFNFCDDQVIFLKGWFKDTIPVIPTDRIAILRLDGDMYESTIIPLNYLFDKLSLGGWVIVDDYWVVPACKAAVGDFLSSRGIEPKFHEIDGVGIYFQKSSSS
jgi:O-methyltransferase